MTDFYIKIFGLAFIIIAVNALYIKWKITKSKEQEMRCISGDYKGQTHKIEDWRKIAVELARTTKNSRINAIAKHGTDEDIIGLLYINFGIELVDNGFSE